MSFAGIILLVIVLIASGALTGVAGRRMGIVAGIAGLGCVALLVLGGVIYLWRGVAMAPVAPPTPVMWPEPHAAMSVSWQDDAFRPMPPNVAHAQWRISLFPLLLLAGAVATIFLFTLFRRSGGATCAVGSHRGWWPAALLLLFVPLGFFFLVSTPHVQRQATVTTRFDAQMHAQQIHERVALQQAELERRQAELTQRTGELNSELQHRIENMEIHKLMDLVDAPRIILPIPTPAAIAQWAQLAADQQSGKTASRETASAAWTNEAVPPEAEVQAEADAAVQLIAAEGEAASAPGIVAEAGISTSDSESSRRRGGHTPQRGRGSLEKATPTRPSWVDQIPKRVGHTQRQVIATEEYVTERECQAATDVYLMLATYNHIQELTGNLSIDRNYPGLSLHRDRVLVGPYSYPITDFDFRRDPLQKMGIGVGYIRREIAKDEYLEKVERSFGPMLKLYTLIEFSPSVDNELRQRWEASQRQERFALVGFGASGVLGLLGLAWGLLKVDTWTKGYYTKRLFIGVPLAVIGTFGLYALLLELGFDLPH